jgi:hypothetical protein
MPAGPCCRFVPSRDHRSRLQSKNLSCQVLQFCNDPVCRVKPHTMTALAFHPFSKTIDIPAGLRGQPLETCSGRGRISVRLTAVLRRSGVHVLGDLHGRKLDDYAWERNCGFKTLHELDSHARRASRDCGRAEKATSAGNGSLPCRDHPATAGLQQTRNKTKLV